MENETMTFDEKQLTENRNEVKQREIFTDKEASQYLRISQVTLWRERKKGKIFFRRVASKIIYLKEDLEKYLEQNKRGGFAASSEI